MAARASAIIGLVGLLSVGAGLLALLVFRPALDRVEAPPSWKQYRFGFASLALVFLAFDMEMIFMYPWAAVFARHGWAAFADMLVFIGLLGSGIVYAWKMGALRWE